MQQKARERLFAAVLAELARGREEIPLEKVLASVGTSRADFDAEFGDLDDCLAQAYEWRAGTLHGLVAAQCSAAQGPGWPERVRSGLRALLVELARDPQMTSVLVREYPGRGEDEQRRYHSLLESFVPLLSPGRSWAEDGQVLPREVELLAVGAAEAIISAEIDAGRGPDLPRMCPSILFSLLVPFLGPERAAAERERSPQDQ